MINALNEEKKYEDFISKNNFDKIKINYDIKNCDIKNYDILEKYVGDLTLSPIKIMCNFINENKDKVSKSFKYIPGITITFDEFYNNLNEILKKESNILEPPIQFNKNNNSAKDYVKLYRILNKKIKRYVNKDSLPYGYNQLIYIYTLLIGQKYYGFDSKIHYVMNGNVISLNELNSVINEKLVLDIILQDNKVIPINNLVVGHRMADIFDTINYSSFTIERLLSEIINKEYVEKKFNINSIHINYDDNNPIDSNQDKTDAFVIKNGPYYNNLSIKAKDYVENIMKIYDKLLKHKNFNNVIKNETDLITLSILLASFKNDNYLRKFYFKNKIYLVNVLKVLDLDKNFLSDINTYEIKDEYYKLFKNYIDEFYETKEDDIIKKLIDSLDSNNLISRIYSMHTGITVKNNFNEYIENVYNKERIESQKEILTQFKNMNSEVYYLLGYACSYYKLLNKYNDNIISDEEKAAFSLLLSLKYMVTSKYPYFVIGTEIKKNSSNDYKISKINKTSSEIFKKNTVIKSINGKPYNYELIYDLIKGSVDKNELNIKYSYNTTGINSMNLYININRINKQRYKNGINSINLLEYLDIEKNLYYGLDMALNMKENDMNLDFNFDLIEKYYKSFVDLNDSKVKLCSIIEKVLSSKLVNLEDYLKITSVHEIKDLESEVQKYINSKIRKITEIEFEETIKEFIFSDFEENVVRYSTSIIEYLNNINNLKNIKSKKDKIEASLLISFFLSNSHTIKYFEKYGINLSNIFNYFNIDENDFNDKKENFIDNITLIDNDYENIHRKYYDCEDNSPLEHEIPNDNELAYALINKNPFLIKYIKENNINQKDLIYEIQYDEEIVIEPTKEEIIEELKSDKEYENIPNNIFDILNYGDSLSKHTTVIVDEYIELINSNTTDKVLDDLNKSINKVYVIKPAVIEEKKLMDKVFRKEDVILEKEQRSINTKELKVLVTKINDYIELLNQELISFNYIRIYYEIYIEKLEKYINSIKNKISETSSDDELIDVLNSKLNSFMASRSIAKTESIKVLECIKNHFIIMQNLVITRNNILSLLTNEVIVSRTKNNENNTLQINDKVVNIIEDVINNNGSLERLKELNVPSTIIEELNSYLASLNGKEMKLTKGGN